MIDTRPLGLGPVELTVVGLTAGGESLACRPLELTVIPDPPLRAQPTPVSESAAQVVLSRTMKATTQTIESTGDIAWLRRAGVQDGEPFSAAVRVQAETTGVYQVQAVFKGNLTVRIDDNVLMMESHPGYMRSEVPVHLEQGSHELFLGGRLDDASLFEVRFGRQGAKRIPR